MYLAKSQLGYIKAGKLDQDKNQLMGESENIILKKTECHHLGLVMSEIVV